MAADKKLRLLIAYDGSECSDLALRDLKRAGLSRAEAVVISLTDAWLPPEGPVDPNIPDWVYKGSQKHRAEVLKMVGDAGKLADRAKKKIQTDFPDWDVHSESSADTPSWGIIKKADEWKPDLIVMGSHGHSSWGGLGSVSQRVLHHVSCSVRIARGRTEESSSPLCIVIGLDGSSDSEQAVRAVLARAWKEGTAVHLVTSIDAKISTAFAHPHLHGKTWFKPDDKDSRAWIKRMMDASADVLRKKGLTVSSLILEGDPKHVLVDEAKRLSADCIFLGSRGLGAIDRFFLGSVSSAVAARAHCSVEIDRTAK